MRETELDSTPHENDSQTSMPDTLRTESSELTPQRRYMRFLSLLMLNRVYDSRTLKLIFADNKSFYYHIKKAITAGHIKETKITKRKRTTLTKTVYTLTANGLKYLIEKDSPTRDIIISEETLDYITILTTTECVPARRERISRETQALTIASAAGAAIPLENYTHELPWTEDVPDADDTPRTPAVRKSSLQEYLMRNLDDTAYQRLRLYNTSPDAEITFHNSTFVKSAISGSSDYGVYRDHLAGRYNGIIDGPVKSVSIFATPMFGLSWSAWKTEKEVTALQLWIRHCYGQEGLQRLRDSGACAAIVVTDAKQFENLYKDKDNQWKENGDDLGGRFDHLYVIPLSVTGGTQLNWLVNTDDADENDTLVEDAVNSGLYRKNTGSYRWQYPLISKADGSRSAIGFQLDAKRMRELEKIARSLPEESFTILSHTWQLEYYKRIMPDNVKVIAITAE